MLAKLYKDNTFIYKYILFILNIQRYQKKQIKIFKIVSIDLAQTFFKK